MFPIASDFPLATVVAAALADLTHWVVWHSNLTWWES